MNEQNEYQKLQDMEDSTIPEDCPECDSDLNHYIWGTSCPNCEYSYNVPRPLE